MGRKKVRPIRSRGIFSNDNDPSVSGAGSHQLDNGKLDETIEEKDSSKPVYIDVDRSCWNSDEHFDLAEVILDNVHFNEELIDSSLARDSSSYALRFRLHGIGEGSFRLGHWPLLQPDDILLEYVVSEKPDSKDYEATKVLCSGAFDGQGESVSGLAHLVSLKFVSLRPILEAGFVASTPSFRVRVEILRSAFDACGSLLDIARQPWKKSMMKVMSWLRPEVTTSETIYGANLSNLEQPDVYSWKNARSSPQDHVGFDAAGFYEAIKPSKEEPMLKDELPNLLPQLRPYQRRAAYWMVQREQEVTDISKQKIDTQLYGPLCIPVTFLESHSSMFYNPFGGNVSLRPELPSSYVSGGILADEMGLGKTVELLACIFAHPKPSSEGSIISDDETQDGGMQIKRRKQERVECVCGAASESTKYKGLWVQCDICDAWQHADCVGYSPKKQLSSHKVHKTRGTEEDVSISSKNDLKKKTTNDIIEMDGSYICSLCSELTEAANSNVSTGATLIVCPAPILAQWHSEISRHTRPGSLKITIYEGARNLNSLVPFRTDIGEVATADVVLTTYDVLREDLSHDSDRHDGDRRFMRFQKRYPVVPTLLTRIHWWRLCLDEAQMVECNTGSVTEMAMRLRARHRWCVTGTPIQHKLDDLYGLLRFLRARPFDFYKLWAEVIRDPYERKDMIAAQFAHNFFRQIMWRSSKVHVSDELELPPQEECVSWLTFSPIEEHFYQKQHETCVIYAREIIENLKDDFHGSDASSNRFLSHDEVAKLLFPLLKLRQACCHPQVGSSGLCSLQRSPLTMGEILEVLIGKTKTEGEEALRRIVVALNGLAAIAIIENDNKRAVSLYREALALADEIGTDFRLDPLLNLHIHHNLAEVLHEASELGHRCSPVEEQIVEDSNGEIGRTRGDSEYIQYSKRQKICEDGKIIKTRQIVEPSKLILTTTGRSLEKDKQLQDSSSCEPAFNDLKDKCTDYNLHCKATPRCYSDGCLRKECDNIQHKFLSLFISKLSSAQTEFKNTYIQVCSMTKECKNQSTIWWLHALNLIEQNKESSEELIRKIDEAVSKSINSSKPSKLSSRFKNISGLKLTIQNGLDSLQASRKQLLERLMEIDQTMEKPKDEDIERVRYCPVCNDSKGPLCIHCELNDLFQEYEARLFLLRKSNNNGAVIASVEEAMDMRKQIVELNRFFRDKKTSMESINDDKSKQRHARANLQVSRNPSELEIVLGVIKGCAKAKLGREGVASARQHLLLFEVMRKEFVQARCLSVAQAQMLYAHDEIKWATSRLRLRETADEPTSTCVLSEEQLIPSSLQFSSDKFLALSSLEQIKGQLRYLKGIAMSKQKTDEECVNLSPISQDKANFSSPPAREANECLKNDDELCPICHEKLGDQKMVFQCGHIVCCKCCLQLIDQAVLRFGKSPKQWIMCPTCRQHTDMENIAYAVENLEKHPDWKMAGASHSQRKSENSIEVHGSYGTKIEAVTRRILWIKAHNEEEKVIVFSSWNDVLDLLGHALQANNVTFVKMKGGRKSQAALAQFKGHMVNPGRDLKTEEQSRKNNSIQVLLILIQHGANGLNILEAQHVILMEPLLNPAAEAQAISRVHRIGQEKKTFIHRFLVKNTVEESIYKLNQSRVMSSTINVKPKHQDQPALTLQDVESLFLPSDYAEVGEGIIATGTLSHLPPAVAAGLAAERRLMERDINLP